MWVSVYAIVVLGAAAVLVESETTTPDITTPEPVTTTPEPVTTTPEPVTTTPEPVTTTRKPVTTTRKPVTTTPEPVTTTPEPVTTTPEPITNTEPHPVTTFFRPVDCADLLLAGASVSGVYEIYPFTCMCAKPVKVWCDMETDGGGWTVFLSRQHQKVQLDFSRTWNDYKKGFGIPYSEYYLGNDVLHQMTFSRFYAIRLDVTLASGGYDFATYQYVKIGSENTRYSASVWGTQLGGTSNTNCLDQMNGRAFITRDRDLDSSSSNCAIQRRGAWWYHSCSYFNPTGPFNRSLILTCKGPNRAVTKLQLKLRPSICDNSFKTVHLNEKGCGCAAPKH
ncbi:ficolin-2-like [Scylla paramamosain]|uniref:ficolin-2-like n=1 Tax=Scylla paramamosain TaxID=85552 RepID=UPI003082EA2E